MSNALADLSPQQADRIADLTETGMTLGEAAALVGKQHQGDFNPEGFPVAAYLAGVWALNGAIKSRVKNQNTGWVEWSLVFSGPKEALEGLQEIAGGSVHQDKATHRLTVYGKRHIQRLLLLMLPYCRIRGQEILDALTAMSK